jgi:hypothetical protein
MDNQNQPPVQAQPAAPPPAAPTNVPQSAPIQTPPDTHMILVILLLVFVYPIGLIAMWALMKQWPAWLKWLISSPVILAILGVVLAIALIAIKPMWR